jgi:hypothetical protein
MKIRQGFVSNSSSSSFIIELLEENQVCSHCGRKDPDLVDMIERGNGWCSDDTHMSMYDKEEVLKWIEEEICDLQGQVMELSRDDPNRELHRSNWGGEDHVTYVKDRLEDTQTSLKAWEDLRSRVEPATGKVVKFYMSYHDELRKVLDGMVAAGSVKILDSEND